MSYRAKCPIRPGDPCSLCFPGAAGPQDCGLVWLAKEDPELVEAWRNRNAMPRAELKPADASENGFEASTVPEARGCSPRLEGSRGTLRTTSPVVLR